MSEEVKKLRLRITGQTEITSWRAKQGGGQTTLYDVEAVDEKGNKPDLVLRAFGELPQDDLQEFTLKKYTHPEHGVSWTIQKPSGGVGKKMADVEGRLADLEARLRAIEARLGDPEPDSHPAQSKGEEKMVRGPGFAGQVPPLPQGEDAELDRKFGEKAPWDD